MPHNHDYRKWAECFSQNADGLLTADAILDAISTPRIYLCFSEEDDAYYLDFFDDNFGCDDTIEVTTVNVQELLKRGDIVCKIISPNNKTHIYVPAHNGEEAERLIQEYFIKN